MNDHERTTVPFENDHPSRTERFASVAGEIRLRGNYSGRGVRKLRRPRFVDTSSEKVAAASAIGRVQRLRVAAVGRLQP
jgi:hypothetical protein